jgi:hypothetical protein
MRGKFLNTVLFLMSILVLGLLLNPMIRVEGFSGGEYPLSVDTPLLDDYPLIGKNDTSNNNYNRIWDNKPVFTVGSFKQLTNNLKYYKNPDNGQCVRSDFCNAIYYDKKNALSNEIKQLPQAEEGEGARVGYFRSEPNELFFSIPTNENILY